MRHWLTFIVILLLLILSACDLISSSNSNGSPVTATPTATLPATPVLSSTPLAPPPITSTDTSAHLTIWTPPDTIPASETGATVFFDQLLAFNADHPDLETHVEQKSVAGQGGILNYLRTGANVAPSILPDLIALPTNQLAAAANEGLIYPLDDLLDPALLDDLYPAARAMARAEEQTVGYPFAITNLTHLAYQTSVITTTPPLRWNEFTTQTDGNFIFPAGGESGALLALQLYLAAGGPLVNEAGQTTLDAPLLAQALQQLSQARSTGFILLQSSNIDTLAESWQVFQAGTAVFTLTTANEFLAQRALGASPGYTVIAGPDRPLTPQVSGWAWAISASDPGHRAQAAELLAFLVSASNLGQWSQQSNQIPARRQALAAWPDDDAYANFLQLELERAQHNLVVGGQIMTVLTDAVFGVISLAKTPQEAAEEAVTALQS